MLMVAVAFLLMISTGLAQVESSFITIQGVVKDARTRKPIAFASIFVPEAQIGTVTNLDGFFTLKVDKSIDAKSFTISHLGYRLSNFSVEEYARSGRQEFLMEVNSVMLDEVVIRPDDARQLVLQAINKIEQNYPGESQRLTGFYREAIRQRRDYVSIIEAIVDIDQTPYGKRSATDRVKVIQGRKSGEVKKMDTLLVKLQGGPHVSMLLDVVKNRHILLSKEWLDAYVYEYEEMVKIENEANYVISFKPRFEYPFPLYYGKLYISVDRLAITMAEFSLDLDDVDKAIQNFVVKKPARLRFTPTRTNYLVTYKEIDGKYYLNYVRNELEFFADWKRKIFRTRYVIMSEMAITELKGEQEDKLRYRDSFHRRHILADMVPVYFDKDFWGSYNVIEPEESIESAIRKFNKRLEDE